MGDSQPRRLEELLARELVLFAALAGAALIQVGLLATPLGLTPPLLLVLVICRTLLGAGGAFPDLGLLRAMRWAFYGGIILDLVASTSIGSHALALLVATLLISLAVRRLRIEGPLIPLLSVLVAAVVYELILALLSLPLERINWPVYLRVLLMPSVLLALIPTLPIFFVMRWALRRGE